MSHRNRGSHTPEADARVGCDIQATTPVAASVRRYGHRYLRAVFAPTELADLALHAPSSDTPRPGPHHPDTEPSGVGGTAAGAGRTGGAPAASSGWPVNSLTARFAAKEAVYKVLAPGPDEALAWPQIAVRRTRPGAPRRELTGAAARLARRRGLTRWSVSLSHDGDYAMAVVLGAPGTRPLPELSALDAAAVTLPPRAPYALVREPRRPPTRGATDHDGVLCPPANHPHTPTHETKENPIMAHNIEATVRTVLAEHAKLGQDAHELARDADLYRAGMTSHASVNVMLSLEDEFDVEFPEDRLTKATFTSIDSICAALEEISDD